MKKLLTVAGLILVSLSLVAQNKSNEIGINLITHVFSPYVGYGNKRFDNLNFVSGINYKHYTDQVTYRAYIGRETSGSELDGRKSNGVHIQNQSRSVLLMVGLQKGWVFNKIEVNGLLDLKYARRKASGENWGGIVAGGSKYWSKDRILGIAPGVNLTYRFIPKLSLQYESSFISQKVWRTVESISSGADLTSINKDQRLETMFKPISMFSIHIKI